MTHTNELTFFRIYFTEKLNQSSSMLVASTEQINNNMQPDEEATLNVPQKSVVHKRDDNANKLLQ